MGRKIIYIVSGLIVVLLLVALLLPFIIDANKFKPQVESAAESALARKVAIGNIRLALFSGGVSVDPKRSTRQTGRPKVIGTPA